MEIYEEVAVNKRRKFIRRASIFIGVLTAGTAVYFFAFGAGNGFLKNNTAIAVRSFREAFGLSLSGNAKEIALGDLSADGLSSTGTSSSSTITNENDPASGTADANITENNLAHSSASENTVERNMQADIRQPSGGKSVSGSRLDGVAASGTVSSTIMPDSGDFPVITSDTFEVPTGVPDSIPNSVSGTASASGADPSDLSFGEPSSTSLLLENTSSSNKKPSPQPRCVFAAANDAVPSHRIILNEVAWMGSPAQSGESAAGASNDEWMEIKNETSSTVSLAGWELVDAAGNITVVFGDSDSIAPSAFYLLKRTDDDAIPRIPADKIYFGALPNTGDTLGIFDGDCAPVDLLDASEGWPGGDNGTKRTLERDRAGFGWHTSTNLGGTPKAENSAGFVAPVAVAASSTAASSSYAANDPSCDFLNNAITAASSSVAADASSSFDISDGSGSGDIQPSSTSVAASDAIATTTDASGTSPTAEVMAHLVIAAVQIAGASTTDDFVKIYNPENAAIDVSGWKLRKKSNTGADYSLKEFPAGSVASAGGIFTWANSANGFPAAIGADVSSTATLAADNSVALFDAAGAMVDAVAWGTGANQYAEGAAYPTDPAAGQTLTRIFQNGAIVDTDNNAADFTIQ